jgi:hypothetical protein
VLGLQDAWRGKSEMTWKRNNVMSSLDRVFTRLIKYKKISITTDWTLCESDHALVHATYVSKDNRIKGTEVCKLNLNVVRDSENLVQLRTYLSEQLETLDNDADPHLRLKFAKMTIRTKALELGKNAKC